MLKALHQHPRQVFPANLSRRRILILHMLSHLWGAPYDFCAITAPEAEATPNKSSTLQAETQVTGQKDALGLFKEVQQVQAVLTLTDSGLHLQPYNAENQGLDACQDERMSCTPSTTDSRVSGLLEGS